MPTYRSDVVGSLLRPAYLVEARRGAESGRLGPAAFKRLEDRAVDEAIDLQEAAGLHLATRGPMPAGGNGSRRPLPHAPVARCAT